MRSLEVGAARFPRAQPESECLGEVRSRRTRTPAARATQSRVTLGLYSSTGHRVDAKAIQAGCCGDGQGSCINFDAAFGIGRRVGLHLQLAARLGAKNGGLAFCHFEGQVVMPTVVAILVSARQSRHRRLAIPSAYPTLLQATKNKLGLKEKGERRRWKKPPTTKRHHLLRFCWTSRMLQKWNSLFVVLQLKLGKASVQRQIVVAVWTTQYLLYTNVQG